MHILRLITYTHPNVIDIEHALRVIGCRVVETENHPTQEVHEVVSGNKGQDNLSADNLRLRALSWIVHAKEPGDTVDQRALRARVLTGSLMQRPPQRQHLKRNFPYAENPDID